MGSAQTSAVEAAVVVVASVADGAVVVVVAAVEDVVVVGHLVLPYFFPFLSFLSNFYVRPFLRPFDLFCATPTTLPTSPKTYSLLTLKMLVRTKLLSQTLTSSVTAAAV